MNSSGPSTEPSGIPELNLPVVDPEPLKRTCCVRSHRNDSFQDNVDPVMPIVLRSRLRRILISTVSNTELRSRSPSNVTNSESAAVVISKGIALQVICYLIHNHASNNLRNKSEVLHWSVAGSGSILGRDFGFLYNNPVCVVVDKASVKHGAHQCNTE